MTARIFQTPTLILGSEDSKARVLQAPTLVLWSLTSNIRVLQAPVLVLGRRLGRRTIGITH